MSLQELKKQLKKRELQTRNKPPRRWPWLLLLILLLGCFLYPVYQQQQLTAPHRLLSEGIALESRGEAEAAQRVYLEIYEQYPETEQAPEALFRSGRIWQIDHRQEQQALLTYLQLEHDYPAHPLVIDAQEEAARIVKYSQRDNSKAIVIYQRLLDGNNSRAADYLYEIADCYFRLDKYDQARIELETLIAEYPDSSLVPDALYRKGGLLLLENHLEEARLDWQRLIKEYPNSPYRAQAQFNLARSLEEENRLKDALEQYQQLKDYPRPHLLKEKIKHLKQRIANKKKAI